MSKDKLNDVLDYVFEHYLECDLEDNHREEVKEAYKKAKKLIIKDVNRFVGKTIADFFCNGFFGSRRYDLAGSEIVAVTDNSITIKDSDGDVSTAYFEEGWQLDNMEELISQWIGEKK